MSSLSSVSKGDGHPLPLAAKIQLILAVLVFGWAGFFMMDFLLSGVYTWPRVSRALVLAGAAMILFYEFVYKEQRARVLAEGGIWDNKILFYACVLPFMLGTLGLLAIVALS